MKGFMPAEGINSAEFPDVLYDLWHWFLDLNAARGGGMGPAPITYLDLNAYASLHRLRFEGWELAAIRRLDGVALGLMG